MHHISGIQQYIRVVVLLLMVCVSIHAQQIRPAGPERDMPLIAEPKSREFFFFGMGNREKYLYKDGKLIRLKTKETVCEWNVKSVSIQPELYTVTIKTEDGQTITLQEDEDTFWISEGVLRKPLTAGYVRLPKFEKNSNSRFLRVLHHEILINIVDSKPLPNFLVYDKPWYRDGAMVAMCLKETRNLDLIKPWILSLSEPFDLNNAGYREADNLGQALYLISLASNKDHPLVQKILDVIPEFKKENYIEGMSDFAKHPVYQTKWLKFGLRSLRLKDPYEIPQVQDSYSSLFWWDYKERHVEGTGFSAQDIANYPYLGWAEAHFHETRPPFPMDFTYPLTWESKASQADYEGMNIVSPSYEKVQQCVPHTWHAAEMFLYLLDEKIPRYKKP